MKVSVGISNRHVHLTKEDYYLLFEEDMTKEKDLTQTGEFASNSKVTIEGPENKIENVRVLGPFRLYTQVEISKTDSYHLGINPPIKNSGELEEAENITIIGPIGKITRKACIIANRHIHINPEERKQFNLMNDTYKVRITNEKGGILDNVYIKEKDTYKFELHIDRDDANANLLNQGDFLEILE